MAINSWLVATAKYLASAGIAHQIVIAGRQPAPTYGREYFSDVKLKLNFKNQAGPAWQSFLRKAGLKATPYEYKAAWEGGIFRYRYTNSAKSIYVFTQGRPDISEHGRSAGWAGDVVVLVTDESSIKFGVVRSALVSATRTGVAKSHVRKTKEQILMEDMLAHNVGADKDEPAEFSYADADAILHAHTLQLLRLKLGNKHISSLAEYGALYEKCKKQIQEEQAAHKSK